MRREATLCYLLRPSEQLDEEVCLGVKKPRKDGYVSNWLNAPGGHVKSTEGESRQRAAVREVDEEWEVIVREDDLEQIAQVCFLFPGGEHADLDCYIYATRRWQGEPHETDEMGWPEWYLVKQLPFHRMPPADRLWLPRALRGERWRFVFQLDRDSRPLNEPEIFALGPD